MLEGEKKSEEELAEAAASGQTTVGSSERTSGLGSGMSLVIWIATFSAALPSTSEKPVMSVLFIIFLSLVDENRVAAFADLNAAKLPRWLRSTS